jgi:hypothetical protein
MSSPFFAALEWQNANFQALTELDENTMENQM